MKCNLLTYGIVQQSRLIFVETPVTKGAQAMFSNVKFRKSRKPEIRDSILSPQIKKYFPFNIFILLLTEIQVGSVVAVKEWNFLRIQTSRSSCK